MPCGESEGADQVLDEQQIAHLFAVAVNGERPAGSGGQHEVSHPALILGPELAWSIDARHTKNDRSQTVDAGVVVDVLIGGALGAAIGRVEVEWLPFVDAVAFHIGIGEPVAGWAFGRLTMRHRAVHLVG